MSTTSVYSDYAHPGQFPPPMNPDGYAPQFSAGVDNMHLRGNIDPASIPYQATDVNPIAQPQSNLDTIVNVLVQNQSALQETQATFQQNLIDVMHEVARRPNVVAATEPIIQTPQGNTIKLRNVCLFNGKHNEVTPFLSEVQRHIEFASGSFPNDHSKVLFIGLNMKDGILVKWFNQLECSGSPLLHDWKCFVATFRKKFADPSLIKNADNHLDADETRPNTGV
ncbi:hypothetical protein C0991_009027 [Blastosporella zonata]|nr:hypothetical protein C0991_009027 [Blastosporella zonata]